MAADHSHPREQQRIESLVRLAPDDAVTVLDVGARDGCISCRLADRCKIVTALDLETPAVAHPRVTTVAGDARHLAFPDRAFDLVVCAEVLEHVAAADLPGVAAELQRVAARYLLIGVPFEQDLRAGRTLCRTCGAVNPPWGHVNSFRVADLDPLFGGCTRRTVEYVGMANERTNFVSDALYRFAGYPYGTYSQEEGCVHCGARLLPVGRQTLVQRTCSRIAHLLDLLLRAQTSRRPLWVHALYVRA